LFPPLVHSVLQYFWLPMLLFVLGLAVFWRLAAQPRIAADPALRQPLNRLYGGFAFWLSLPIMLMGAGILAGAVDNVLLYLRFDGGNVFVVAFWLLVIVEDALFIYWVYFRGGDRLLALHTELVNERQKFRFAARVLAIASPLSHGWAFAYATFSPHFGQALGA
jgi:hypothetical protein